MQHTVRAHHLLAHDDSAGRGPLVVLVPGAGDLRSENRFLVPALVDAGYRVVNVDLPGHGESPTFSSYGVEETAGALIDLIRHLDGGPAVVVGCSFAPAAAIWAAAEQPNLIMGIVAVSPHLDDSNTLSSRIQGLAVSAGLRGAWAGKLWAGLYTGWYKSSPPGDLDEEIARQRFMLSDPVRRRAVRETLLAHRRGVAERMEALTVPSLTIFGSKDDHFPDPVDEAASVARRLDGPSLVVDGAGHYPHVEQPDTVARAIIDFVEHVWREQG